MQESGVQFGTSGARGMVTAMTDRVCYGYTQGFLSYLRELGEFSGGRVALAGDLRPSTPRILAACAQAIRDLGAEPVFCGYVPTPALALYAFGQGIPSLMVTGSHIPYDRNGIKFYRPAGEVLKSDEAGMKRQLVEFTSAFDADGMLAEAASLPEVTDAATAYIARYVTAFGADALAGRKIGVYQHSAVGRDIVLSIVQALGAEGVPIGRATKFIPVDTEAIRPEDVVLARDWAAEYGFDAIISTDGDSDRPLLADHTGEWLRGDVLGVLCARAIGAGTVVTPVSSNTVLELSGAFEHCARTKIGSPFVIDAMNAALAAGQDKVCGYEANGGFLLASDFGALTALPTRDAVLPVVAVIAAAKRRRVADLLGELPPRVTYSDRIQNFATERSEAIFAALLEGSEQDQIVRLSQYFGAIAGSVVGIDLTDGIRMSCEDGCVLHLRRSGNAPELRCYSEASDAARAWEINEAALKVVLEELA
ncbi:phosphomannomutase [Novosphingobium umbonatum]|uniref:Phosphomannomutase n=2 Tax=Novosphingobium umbonatum TaxID=1908524 RepID=A0A3S2X5V9_9SPHN|nr:phosphomannomutase [Novosphingobium umbonatum]